MFSLAEKKSKVRWGAEKNRGKHKRRAAKEKAESGRRWREQFITVLKRERSREAEERGSRESADREKGDFFINKHRETRAEEGGIKREGSQEGDQRLSGHNEREQQKEER